jgi:hypothetical protein
MGSLLPGRPLGGCSEQWLLREGEETAQAGVMAFYEKVIKVKADVAAFLINCFPFHLSIGITLRW